MSAAGKLRDEISFERRMAADDGYGNTTGAWQTQFTRAAEIIPLQEGEQVIGSRLQGTQPAILKVRFDSQTSTIQPDWRAVDARDGTVYAIKTAADMERRREWITMMVEAGVAA